MIEETYPFAQVRDELVYVFRSTGINGVIKKIVIFTPTKNGKWQNNDVDDKVMTNNHDVVKVIGTVAKITYAFFKEYPNAIVVVKPVDEKRKKLYNIVFQRHYLTIIKDFKILAHKKGHRKVVYSPKKIYDNFELSLKSK